MEIETTVDGTTLHFLRLAIITGEPEGELRRQLNNR
jgi:hypothetical protein